jgi:hypothetical protein
MSASRPLPRGGIVVEQIVTKLVSEFEQGKLSRRQLIKRKA